MAVAGRGQRGQQLDSQEKGKRAGRHAVAAPGAAADGQARHPGGGARVRRVHQGRDGGQMRGLDAESVQGGRLVRGRAQGRRVPRRPVQVSARRSPLVL